MERRCLVCNHVFSNERPVCHVVFFEDGEIQMDCGQDDHGNDETFFMHFQPVGLRHVTSRDDTLIAVLSEEETGISFNRDGIDKSWKKYYI